MRSSMGAMSTVFAAARMRVTVNGYPKRIAAGVLTSADRVLRTSSPR